MGTQITGTGRKRIPNRERLTAEDDALNQIAREAEARLAAKRAARAEAREIRMKELERQQKEMYQSQKKYYGLDNKWGHIEQWMEESERYSSRPSRRHTSISDDEERMSVGSRGSLRRNFSSDLYCSSNSLPSLRHQNSTQNGRPSMLFIDGPRTQSHRGSVCDEAMQSSTRRFSGSISRGVRSPDAPSLTLREVAWHAPCGNMGLHSSAVVNPPPGEIRATGCAGFCSSPALTRFS